MATMSFFEFEDTCPFRVFESPIYSVDICLRQHVNVNYLVGCRFHVAVHLLERLKHTHHVWTPAVGLRVDSIGAVAAAPNNFLEDWHAVSYARLHNVAVA